jgi:hypothetical protein
MASAQDLWESARKALEPHGVHRDRDSQATLNRAACKCLKITFDETTCSITQRNFARDEADSLFTFDDLDSLPHQNDGPIVVLVWKFVNVVIDGRRRVNRWRRSNETRPISAIVISPFDQELNSLIKLK